MVEVAAGPSDSSTHEKVSLRGTPQLSPPNALSAQWLMVMLIFVFSPASHGA